MPAGNITIVGLGLMGGSIGLALGRAAGPWRVVGVAKDAATISRATSLGMIDEGTTDMAEGVKHADLVVFATPVRAIPDLVRASAASFKDGAVVTDVGSTKAELCQIVPSLLPPGVTYVGGHPMAGSEQTGLEAADPYLFENAVYVLTPTTSEDEPLCRVRTFVESLGAQPLVMDAADHDAIVAAVSHLPHIVAAALVGAVADAARDEPRMLALAAGGFRDTTRVASGDPAMWRDICLTNRAPLLDMMARFERVLQSFRTAIHEANDIQLESQLAAARAVRDEIPRHRKGILSTMYEMVVQLADRPGAINEVTACLAAKQLNIRDIEILRVREGEGGTLRLALENEADLDMALQQLNAAGFTARRRG